MHTTKGHKTEGVVLLIMRVWVPKKHLSYVFFDNGSDSNFVRDEFAKLCGFKGEKHNLCVTTLGGVDKNYISVTVYKCSLVDGNGKIESFEAYGMDTITGVVSTIGVNILKRLFPHLSNDFISQLQRGVTVDFLIGMLHPSWHPERAEKAKGGGDFWVWRGRFGACVGGRHREMREQTPKSENLIIKVHQSYHVAATQIQESSHELAFCPRRCENYFHESSSLPIVPMQTSVSDTVLASNEDEGLSTSLTNQLSTSDANMQTPFTHNIDLNASLNTQIASEQDDVHCRVVLGPPEDTLLLRNTFSNDTVTQCPAPSSQDPEVSIEMSSYNIEDSVDRRDVLSTVSDSPGSSSIGGEEFVCDLVINEDATRATKASPLTDHLFFKSQSLGTVG